MKIYGLGRSRAFRVVWAMEEAQLDYEYEHVDLMRGAARQPDYLALNPNGKVPTLVDGDLVLWESGAICNYLGQKVPKMSLIPTDPVRRADYDRWCFFVIGELEQPLWNKGKHTFGLPANLRVPQIIETAHWEFRRAAKVLSTGLGDRSFIVGDCFTMADIMLGHTLIWANRFEFTHDYENVNAYRVASGRTASVSKGL